MQHDNGTGNFTATDDGHPINPNTAVTGYGYAQALIWSCNGQMEQNPVLNMPPGSALTPIPKRVRWVLDGVYFDRSSAYRDGANANGSPARDYAPLCVRGDSVINIFLVEEADWPYVGIRGNTNTNSPVSEPAIRGYVMNQAQCDVSPAPGKLWAVVSSPWTKYVLSNVAGWQMASALNYELCHLMGLNHPFQSNIYTWGECAEAPMNANCWNLNEPAGPNCDAWDKVSNNVMDTNASQSSLAPCQIGIIQNNLNTCLKSRFVYKCSDCRPTMANFELPPGTCGRLTNIWLDGRATWASHWFRLDIDKINSSGQPISGTHYDITQTREPGLEQLDVLYAFAANSRYQVKLTSFTNCGSASVRVRTFDTGACTSLTAPIAPTTTVSNR
ncbi:hypothetical protein I2H31_22625 [Hymenobacter sp. BT662]|uniref:Peptidase M43 pregnancy-associated plasma-A domain-containing protein n=2 Tax=Hymenobacter ruricola TaxID=2791023 RepID=A0ABS0IAB7_9BACT|nr:hypothetical protein [Hymenobacter ruricola]